jgi:hypothetical protein
MPPETLHVPIQDKDKTAPTPIYDIGIQELHRISHDENARRTADHELNEARGRDGARLYVTLKALSEVDRRRDQNTRETVEALQGFARQLAEQVANLERQLQDARASIANQQEASLQSITTHAQESTDRLAVDVRKLRDEVVSLVDSRMNQADASFAALRGDVEVVKYLVMDLIKDRIGRTDPKPKSF